MHIHNDPEAFVQALPLQTVGASPLATSLLSLNRHFPQLVSDATPKALDGVVSDLYRILAMIKFYRGTLVPVHTLPDDILTRIFRFYHSFSGLGGELTWSKVMLVCRRWHSLIMSDGYLWSFIDPSNMARWSLDLHSHIERSGNWPLSICHNTMRGGEADLYIYELLLTRVSNRVRSLQLLYCSKSLILDILRVLGDAGLPELATLEISSSSSPRNGDSDSFILPTNILSLPKLVSLILTDFIVDTSLIPPQLTRLDLCLRSSSVYYDLRGFLDALSTLPNLQILNIEYSVRDILHRYPFPIVHLPSLRILSISGFQDVINHLFASLVVPHTTSVFLATRPVIMNVHTASRDIVVHLRQFFRHPQGTRIRAVKIQNLLGDPSSDFDATIIGFAHKDMKSIDYMSTYDERKAMSLAFFSKSAKRQKQFARKVLTSLVNQAELLDIRSMSRGALSPSWCKMALLSLPALTEVYLSASTSTCLVFCDCLRKLMTTHPKSFPKLRGIYVSQLSEDRIISVQRQRRMYSRGEEVPYMEMTDAALHRRNYEALRDLVRSYEEGGHRLDWLAITNHDFWYWPGVEETREMARMVGTFMFNGEEVYHSEDKPTIIEPTITHRLESLFNGFSEYY